MIGAITQGADAQLQCGQTHRAIVFPWTFALT